MLSTPHHGQERCSLSGDPHPHWKSTFAASVGYINKLNNYISSREQIFSNFQEIFSARKKVFKELILTCFDDDILRFEVIYNIKHNTVNRYV